LKEELIELSGVILEILKGDNFKVRTENNHIAVCKPSGRIRLHKIYMVPGDKVKVEVSPYDLSKGRIVFREKS